MVSKRCRPTDWGWGWWAAGAVGWFRLCSVSSSFSLLAALAVLAVVRVLLVVVVVGGCAGTRQTSTQTDAPALPPPPIARCFSLLFRFFLFLASSAPALLAPLVVSAGRACLACPLVVVSAGRPDKHV
jgi:hypothetical protein